jgi:hypothetical protein
MSKSATKYCIIVTVLNSEVRIKAGVSSVTFY